MRGRFHPKDGQLYACGMFAWAGNQTAPGGFYRVRATGKPMFLPIGLHATRKGLKITFTESDRPRLRSGPIALFRENLVAQTNGELRLRSITTRSRSASPRRRCPTTDAQSASFSPRFTRRGEWRSSTGSKAREASASRGRFTTRFTTWRTENTQALCDQR